MQIIKTHDLTSGWCARLYDPGDMCISHDATEYHLTIPKGSVDTLIDIVAEIRKEKKEK